MKLYDVPPAGAGAITNITRPQPPSLSSYFPPVVNSYNAENVPTYSIGIFYKRVVKYGVRLAYADFCIHSNFEPFSVSTATKLCKKLSQLSRYVFLVTATQKPINIHAATVARVVMLFIYHLGRVVYAHTHTRR